MLFARIDEEITTSFQQHKTFMRALSESFNLPPTKTMIRGKERWQKPEKIIYKDSTICLYGQR
jgi:hypothetical protein